MAEPSQDPEKRGDGVPQAVASISISFILIVTATVAACVAMVVTVVVIDQLQLSCVFPFIGQKLAGCP